jgi:protein TonB
MAGPTPNPKKNTGGGRLFGSALVAEESWSKGFFARLKEFLTEKPMKVPAGAPGALGQVSYGSTLTENLKEFFRQLPPDARKASGKMTVEWRPWYQQFWENLRDTIAPPKLPPLKVTSKPVQVREIWSKREGFQRAQAVSITAHAVVIVLLIVPLYHEATKPPQEPVVSLEAVDISPYLAKLPPGKDKAGGGGGGGERSPTPPTKGRLPKFSMEQLTPAMAVPRNPDPKLAAEPTVIVPPDISVPNPALPNYGDPLQALLTGSGGPGSGGGIGTGSGGGIGSGSGPGVGPGWGGGIGGGAFRAGRDGVGEPQCQYCPLPLYSEEARKAKYQGTVLLRLIVTPDGRATNISVVRGVGLGLDERAIETVRTWRFKPALGPNQQAVPVWVTVEVNFRLL